MREDFLHFCWRWRRFNLNDLQTTDGRKLEILHPGEPNSHAGPDFFNARIRLDGTLWAGTVELHLRASDWLVHGHQHDRAYDNVVLHVVLDDDEGSHLLRRGTNERLPCLTLRQRLLPSVLDTYYRLEHERAWIPCGGQFSKAKPIIVNNWLDRLLVERLEAKTNAFAHLLEECNASWEEAFYRMVVRVFELKVNAEPAEALARSLPWQLLARHRDKRLRLEALLFGQAGMLEEEFTDPYPVKLTKEYRFLQKKHDLVPLDKHIWKFLRLRPANFPSLRLAQLAALLNRNGSLFNSILEATTTAELEEIFLNLPSEYWQHHYQFEKPARNSIGPPGRELLHSLLINAVSPVLFHYGRIHKRSGYQEQALKLLENLPAEKNSLIENWKKLKAPCRTAAQSQALAQLKTRYCDQRRCLECAIGVNLLR